MGSQPGNSLDLDAEVGIQSKISIKDNYGWGRVASNHGVSQEFFPGIHKSACH